MVPGRVEAHFREDSRGSEEERRGDERRGIESDYGEDKDPPV
jgi:hypothetical protein